MSWRKWGDPVDEIVEPAPLQGPALVSVRYCPRCDTATRWTNEHDHGVMVACNGCGLIVGSPLTDDEQDRAEAYDAKPVTLRRRGYVVC